MSRALRLLLPALLLVLAMPAVATARVPFGFVGVMADGPIAAPGFDPAAEMRTMVASGVETVRVVFHWTDSQPYPSFEAIPPEQRAAYRDVDGVPTTFARFDPLVATPCPSPGGGHHRTRLGGQAAGPVRLTAGWQRGVCALRAGTRRALRAGR
jgi:hypothetical protein